jgi:hypothetical protein
VRDFQIAARGLRLPYPHQHLFRLLKKRHRSSLLLHIAELLL